MHTPLNAAASTAGSLISGSTFEIPPFQREYSWLEDEVADFWQDLKGNLESESYFLGLIILTDDEKDNLNGRKYVVDGQQRLVTLTLLAAALYFEAHARGRVALADRIQADFLRSIDYGSDETTPRVHLSDGKDNATFQHILDGKAASFFEDPDSVSARMVKSFLYLQGKLRLDLASDPFKRLGKWTEFITHKLYFAVFVHPDTASAYEVYEVINTRGRELTTADLLKNYVLSQTKPAERESRYKQWQNIASQFPAVGTNSFVQYIRHAVTVQSGHVLPKDLFEFLADRRSHHRRPPSPDQLMGILERELPLYLQMNDPTVGGPAEPDALKIFSALNSLGVIAVRPMLLAVASVPDALDGMKYILRLVVRRIVVGNLGTGNVERRFGEAARKITENGSWASIQDDLKDLNPTKEDFVQQLSRRSFNKGVLAFLRRSIVGQTITPSQSGTLHLIWTSRSKFKDMTDEEGAYWVSTIGNTFLSVLERRPKEVVDWSSFKAHVITHPLAGEWDGKLQSVALWDSPAVEKIGTELAEAAGDVWY